LFGTGKSFHGMSYRYFGDQGTADSERAAVAVALLNRPEFSIADAKIPGGDAASKPLRASHFVAGPE
jgi:hypothetical protein